MHRQTVWARRLPLLLLVLIATADRSVAAARAVSKRESPPLIGQDDGYGSSTDGGEDLAALAASNSWMSRQRSRNSRQLLADDTIEVVYSNASAVCPSSTGDWAAIEGYGHLVSDNWACSNPARRTTLQGASAQDYGVSRPLWATFGWAAFQTPTSPGGTVSNARLEGLNLLILGNQGMGGVGSCSINSIDIAIYSNSNGAPDATQWSAALMLAQPSKPNSKTFAWSGNTSAVLSFDIVDKSTYTGADDLPAVLLDFDTVYWLRVQLSVPYGGTTGNAKCFVHWVLNNATKTGNNCLWQEARGGSAGYSTTCVGAASVTTLPAANQTLYSCFNGGTQGSTGSRRCDTYRSSTNASQPLTCPAQFLDFCFAFWGNNAVNCTAKPTLTLSNGTWPDSCAGTAVGSNCNATCTWSGSASTKCLATGAWSTSITGQCNPPTNCTAAPTAEIPGSFNDTEWSPSCPGTLVDQNCSAVCIGAGSNNATVECLATGEWSATAAGSCET